jgi:16S rRNA (cytosine1402-N4)-methyltransferase
MMYHEPVLAQQSVHFLVANRQGYYVDGTLGGGGHSEIILENLNDQGRLVGIDQDPEAIAFCRNRFKEEQRLTIVQSNFASIDVVLQDQDVESVDGILLDLGISSHQIDSAERGFSFQQDGPLDMRMNSQESTNAADFLNTATVEEIDRVIWRYGEERQHRRISSAIVRARDNKPITGTRELRAIIESASSPVHVHKTCARVFQALRIAINDELEILEQSLEKAYGCLKEDGRIVVISYHSLEDRIVKQFLKDIVTDSPMNPYQSTERNQRFEHLTKKPIVPENDEILRNPRSRSARLRAAQKK